MKKMLAVLGVIFCVNAYAETNKQEHYILRYDSGNTYDVKIMSDTITWTGLRGEDRGKTETDSIKRKLLGNIEVIQWTEKSGTFVTLVLDRKNHRSISSGKDGDSDWLTYGVAEIVKN